MPLDENLRSPFSAGIVLLFVAALAINASAFAQAAKLAAAETAIEQRIAILRRRGRILQSARRQCRMVGGA